MHDSHEALAWGVGRLPVPAQDRFLDGLAWCERFFMGEAEVQKALFKLVGILDTEQIPHVVIGGSRSTNTVIAAPQWTWT